MAVGRLRDLYDLAMPRGAARLLAVSVAGILAIGLSGCASAKKSGINGNAAEGQGIGQPSPFLGANLSTVSCGPTELCAAGGTPFQDGSATPILAYSHTAGIKWAPARTSAGAAAGATITTTACAEVRCLAVGVDGDLPLLLSISRASTTRTWVSADQPAAGTLVSVGCAGTSTCVGIARTPSGGLATVKSTSASWRSLGEPPAQLASPIRVSCSSATTCTAVGTSSTGKPVVLVTRSGGASWDVAKVSKKATVILGASCRSDAQCWVVGRKGTAPLLASSPRRGAPFLKVAPPEGLATPNDVSCSATTCVVAGADQDGAGAAAAYVGASSSLLDLSFVPTALVSVSCGTARSCSAASAGSLVALVP